ncbi:hypothetical protein Ddc_22162 [Ditylenchus destructor]|nr:hypothetical protein Ddc_22162 [Ditylenchus destructor]
MTISRSTRGSSGPRRRGLHGRHAGRLRRRWRCGRHPGQRRRHVADHPLGRGQARGRAGQEDGPQQRRPDGRRQGDLDRRERLGRGRRPHGLRCGLQRDHHAGRHEERLDGRAARHGQPRRRPHQPHDHRDGRGDRRQEHDPAEGLLRRGRQPDRRQDRRPVDDAEHQSIPYDGSATAALTITSLDANRTAVGGTPVTLSVVDPANTAFVTAASTTDATSGQLVATISVGASRTARPVTVTAVSGTVSRSITLNIVAPPSTTPAGGGHDPGAGQDQHRQHRRRQGHRDGDGVDAQRNVIAAIPVAFTTTDAGATVAVQNGTTNASGQAIATVNSGADKSNRLITVVASSGALTKTATFQVLGTKLVGTALPQQPVAGSTGNRIDYRLSDVNQNPMTFVPISVSAPGLPSASGQTDASGSYTFTYTAPATSGPIDITATAGGVSTVNTVTVPNSSSTVPTATPSVVSASVRNPTVVSVNTSTTSNRSEIRALFQAASNAPVKNVRIVYSDTSGLATTSYSPGSRPSPTSGVTIRAAGDYKRLRRRHLPKLGADDADCRLRSPVDLDRYQRHRDEDRPHLSQELRGAATPPPRIGRPTTTWTASPARPAVFAALPAEPDVSGGDVNRNGLIDGVEDQNGNKQLDPRKSDASISMSGSTRTDANGQAVLVLEYPQSVASWVRFQLSASALGVLSPPATYNDVLPVDSETITDSTHTPAFVVSPYGRRRVAADGSFCKNAD